MEDQQKTRLVILGVAGTLFLGGMGAWYWYNSSKPVVEPDYETVVHKPASNPAVASSVPIAKPGSTPAGAPVAPGGTATAPGATATAPGATATAPGAAATAPGAAATAPGAAATAPGAAGKAGGPGAVATAPGGTNPAANPAATSSQPTATKPVAPASAVQPAAAPNGQVKPAVATTAPGVKPAVTPAVATTAVKPGAKSELDKFPGKPAASPVASKPEAGAKPEAKPAVAKGAPNNGKPNGAPLPDKLAKAPEEKPSTPTGTQIVTKEVAGTKENQAVEATTEAQAAKAAREKLGRPDPMEPLSAFLPFPRLKLGGGVPTKDMAAEVPPPPPEADEVPAPVKDKKAVGVGATQLARKGMNRLKEPAAVHEPLVPPPPPSAEPLSANGGGLPIEQLPVPPSKPTIGDKMRVLAVMDDKVIISFPRDMSIKNKWPKTMTLATGQEFESIRVVGVGKDGVTIEEDGERTLKPIPTVK